MADSTPLRDIARQARAAAQRLAASSHTARISVLQRLQAALSSHRDDILAANVVDVTTAERNGLEPAVLKRLVLDDAKVASLIAGLSSVIDQADPLGVRTLHRELTPGLRLERVTCPLGVLLIIFEARPEAVIQIASLALKSGNAVILKGGKEAQATNACLVSVLRGSIGGGDVPVDAVQLVSSREDVHTLLGQDDYIDLVIPRGSNALVRQIKASTRIPVLGHADGICSVYIDAAAEGDKAVIVAVDSKVHYPAACNAAERLLIHADAVPSLLPRLVGSLLAAGVTLHCDATLLPAARAAAAPGDSRIVPMSGGDDAREWLSMDLTLLAVDTVEAAMRIINDSGSHHTDAIVTENEGTAQAFMRGVDSAGVYWNASTRFADGFRYGFGAEVGVSTSRLHARGPVGLEGLLTYKYLVTADGGTAAAAAAMCVGGAFHPHDVAIGDASLPAKQYTHVDL